MVEILRGVSVLLYSNMARSLLLTPFVARNLRRKLQRNPA